MFGQSFVPAKARVASLVRETDDTSTAYTEAGMGRRLCGDAVRRSAEISKGRTCTNSFTACGRIHSM